MIAFVRAASNLVDCVVPEVVKVVIIVDSVIDKVDSAIVVIDSMTVVIDCVVVVVDFVFDIVDSMFDADCMTRHPRSKNEQINLIMHIGDGVCLAKFVNYRLYLLSFTIYE